MTLRQYRPLLIATLWAAAFYIINRLLFLLPDFKAKYTNYQYPLETLYLFFWVCAIIILFVLLRVYYKTPDNTGYVYLGATMVQMGVSYIMLRPILNSGAADNSFEKGNFFAIFILFLAIETIITIRLLNNKQ